MFMHVREAMSAAVVRACVRTWSMCRGPALLELACVLVAHLATKHESVRQLGTRCASWRHQRDWIQLVRVLAVSSASYLQRWHCSSTTAFWVFVCVNVRGAATSDGCTLQASQPLIDMALV